MFTLSPRCWHSGVTNWGMISPGRPKSELTLSADESARLEQLARRGKSAQALALRARVVLACATGLSNGAVAQALRLCPHTVGKWRERFVRDRLAGLGDEVDPERETAGTGWLVMVRTGKVNTWDGV